MHETEAAGLQGVKVIETIARGDTVLAILIRREHTREGIQGLTPDAFSQQLIYMQRPAGYTVDPHVHNHVKREVEYTQEVLFIKSGKVRVDLYDDQQDYVRSTVLNQGDVILLAFGGHGFEMLEASELIEVKQGPYAGDADKVRFAPVSRDQLKY